MKNKKSTLIIASLIAIVLIATIGVAYTNGWLFSLVGKGEPVKIPVWGYIECGPTKSMCYPDAACNNPKQMEALPKDGKIHCGQGSESSSYIPDGCKVTVYRSGTWWIDWATANRYTLRNEADGTTVSGGTITLLDAGTGWGQGYKTFTLQQGQYVQVDVAWFSDLTYRVDAQIWGLRIIGGGMPVFTNRCNLASAMQEGGIKIAEGQKGYQEILAAGEISRSQFPYPFITGYSETYDSTNLLTIDGNTWYVPTPGKRCKVEQDSSGTFIATSDNTNYYVTDNCVDDTSIQCFPNIRNCDASGKLITDQTTGKTCIPGTLIGTQLIHVAIDDSTACKMRCSSSGIPESYDCKKIPTSCPTGKVLDNDYTCADATIVTPQTQCEQAGGVYTKTIDKNGQLNESCDTNSLGILPYLIIGACIIIAGIATAYKKKGKK